MNKLTSSNAGLGILQSKVRKTNNPTKTLRFYVLKRSMLHQHSPRQRNKRKFTEHFG